MKLYRFINASHMRITVSVASEYFKSLRYSMLRLLVHFWNAKKSQIRYTTSMVNLAQANLRFLESTDKTT